MTTITPASQTVEVRMSRHRTLRRHSTWRADVPVEMLTDPTYIDPFGEATSAFDQWMCDNGDESAVQFSDDERTEDLGWEVEVIDDKPADRWIANAFERATQHRVVRCGDEDLLVQLGAVSKEYALTDADENGVYTGYVFVAPDFFSDLLGSGDGLDAVADQLAEALHDDLVAEGLGHEIVGFDYEHLKLIVRVSNDVAAASEMGS